jgi:SAM-dependent methyltransferase
VSFGDRYASAYDALYHDKDYGREADFIDGLLKGHGGLSTREILDVGCGTGRHAIGLAERGYRVHGVDLSEYMLSRARVRVAELPASVRDLLSFSVGDARHLDLGRQFDAVVSLFHVISYQASDQDLMAALAVARRHLRKGGLFLFDFWNGPTVVSEGVAPREKTVEDGKVRAVRRTTPVWEKDRDIVRVIYDLEVTELASGRSETSREEHIVRYYFCERLSEWLRRAGFEVLEQAEWLTKAPPGDDTFSVYFVARAV